MRRGSSSPRFANTAEEIQASFERFYDQSLAQPTDPNVLYTMEHDLMSAGVLDVDEMTAAATALLSDDPALQPQIYANLEPAVMRFVALDDDAQTELRAKLTQYCRAYAFVSQVMPWTDADLERMFLYGKLLLAELPASDSDPIPQLSRSVQLTHLRLSVTGEGSIELGDDTEPGVALPGEGKGSANEPEKDKLSALIEMMNEKYGADLGEPDKVWIDQQRAMILDDEDVARNRSLRPLRRAGARETQALRRGGARDQFVRQVLQPRRIAIAEPHHNERAGRAVRTEPVHDRPVKARFPRDFIISMQRIDVTRQAVDQRRARRQVHRLDQIGGAVRRCRLCVFRRSIAAKSAITAHDDSLIDRAIERAAHGIFDSAFDNADRSLFGTAVVQ